MSTQQNSVDRTVEKMIPKWLTGSSTHDIKPWMKVSAGAFVVFSIVMLAMYCKTMGDSDASLYGFWEVDSDFAEKAQLDVMYVYIGAPDNDAKNSIGPVGKDLAIYILLKADGAIRFNESVKSYVSRRSFRTDAIQKFSIDFGKPVSIIPRKISAEYDPVTQMLVLRDPKKVYARMFKKPEVSFYCTSESIAKQKSGKHDASDSDSDSDSSSDDDVAGDD